MACEAMDNGSVEEAQFVNYVMEAFNLPNEVKHIYSAHLRDGIFALFTQTYTRVRETVEALRDTSDEQLKSVQHDAEPFTKPQYYK